MESGVNKKDIKIKSGSLFVKGKKHGYVNNSVYCSVIRWLPWILPLILILID